MNLPLPKEALSPEVKDQTDSFHEYLRTISRHRYSILMLTLLFGLFGGLKALMDVPIYRSTAVLVIEREAAQVAQAREQFAGMSSTSYEYFQTQYELLRTRPLAERVVEIVGAKDIFAGQKGTASLSLDKLLPSVGEEEEPEIPAEEAKLHATGIVLGSMNIEPVRNSQLVKISYETPSAELSARLANAHGQAYIESMLDARLQMISQASTWLSQELETQRRKVDNAEKALQQFREDNRLLGLTGVSSLAAQQISMLSEQVAQAQSKRLEKESLYRQVREARQRNASLDTIPDLVRYPLVSELKSREVAAQKRLTELSARYGPQHPSMVNARAEAESAATALRGQLDQIADTISREYESAQAVERKLNGELNAAKAQLQQEGRQTVQETQLVRQLEAERQVYESMMQQFNQTSRIKGLDSANARVAEAALPNHGPVAPNVRRIVIAAALIGFVLAVGLAFVLEHLDSTVKTAEDVERRLNLPVLGLVPKLKTTGKKDYSPLRHFIDNPKSAYSEAIRTVRTGLLLSAIGKNHKRVLVTSSVPGEGKTTTALNLAQSLSQMGKVLLIDADMRRPTANKVFGIDPASRPGLSQYIAGESKISECVRQLEGSNCFVIHAGQIPNNPLELLSSQKFSDALDSLGRAFDFIVIDCAPTLAVSDALVLSRLVDGVVYVVKCDDTPYQAALSGIKRLRRVDAPLLGVILNRIGERQHGYGYGRYSYYADGYYQHYGYYTESRQVKTGKVKT